MEERREEQKPELYRNPSGDPRIRRTDGGRNVGSEFIRVVRIINADFAPDSDGYIKIPTPQNTFYEIVGRITDYPLTTDSRWRQLSNATSYFAGGNYWVNFSYEDGMIRIQSLDKSRVQILLTDMKIIGNG